VPAASEKAEASPRAMASFCAALDASFCRRYASCTADCTCSMIATRASGGWLSMAARLPILFAISSCNSSAAFSLFFALRKSSDSARDLAAASSSFTSRSVLKIAGHIAIGAHGRQNVATFLRGLCLRQPAVELFVDEVPVQRRYALHHGPQLEPG